MAKDRPPPNRDGEFQLIADVFAPLAEGNPGAFGLTDDAAISAPGEGFVHVFTMDTMVEGTHYLPDDPPADVARKLLRVNLSDLAAMAADPVSYLLSLSLGTTADREWIAAFAQGLAQDQQSYGVHLAGGDTTSGGDRTVLSLTAIGDAAPAAVLRRNGAADGHDIWVSGSIGDAGLGLMALRGECDALNAEDRGALADRYRLPRPRVSLGIALRGIAHAAADVSDGLIADLGHICRASDLGAEIDLETIPLSVAAARAIEAKLTTRLACATAGDDYELVFTAPSQAASAVEAAAIEAGTAVARIGRISATAEGVAVMDAGKPVDVGSDGGWRHF